ncbi:hypothetical protein [Flavobacterium beibuense]|uniref:hypothetical protein n=1 Tax=Flavobacterium beibuense TaxID=657326 RepID=UPI003A8DF611
MENQTIRLKEALEIFNRRDSQGQFVPFDISFRTFSKTTKRGGELKVYERVKYVPPANPDEDKEIDLFSLITPQKAAKNPKHFENRTRNIELPNGDFRKINIDFIILVNNFKVIY